jgi:hypothetical protein
LDQEIEAAGWGRVDFLKLDLEGFDSLALKGARGLLEAKRIVALQFEYNHAWAQAGSSLGETLHFLRSMGYRVFLVRSSGLHEFNYELYGEYFRYSNFAALSPDGAQKLEKEISGFW